MIENSRAFRTSQKVFRTRLMDWWQSNHRTFRWRLTENRYEILIAEILLRRTNAAAASKVYADFLNEFPTPSALAKADAASIEALANRLGLFWRGRNLTELSLFFRSGGQIPRDLEGLLKLPGVGPYVGRAVMVNVYGAAYVPVDSNVVRVICRFLGIPANDAYRKNRNFQELADSFLVAVSPRAFNYALLDFAAAVCVSIRPKCQICPLSKTCKSAKLFELSGANRHE